MIRDRDIDAWLGDTGLTPAQRERFAGLVRAHAAVHAGREGEPADHREEDAAAWVAALEIVEGTFDLRDRGAAYVAARDAAYQGAVMATLAGASEVEAARAAAISRPTLRRALGK